MIAPQGNENLVEIVKVLVGPHPFGVRGGGLRKIVFAPPMQGLQHDFPF